MLLLSSKAQTYYMQDQIKINVGILIGYYFVLSIKAEKSLYMWLDALVLCPIDNIIDLLY
jgi:hypothetical protein